MDRIAEIIVTILVVGFIWYGFNNNCVPMAILITGAIAYAYATQ